MSDSESHYLHDILAAHWFYDRPKPRTSCQLYKNALHCDMTKLNTAQKRNAAQKRHKDNFDKEVHFRPVVKMGDLLNAYGRIESLCTAEQSAYYKRLPVRIV